MVVEVLPHREASIERVRLRHDTHQRLGLGRMRDDVDAGAKQILRVLEIEHVGEQACAALVCRVDNRLRDGRRHLRHRAEL